ncbi:MAG: HAD-IIIC family phosphatase, partial [Gemmatimonadaceae bacterium]
SFLVGPLMAEGISIDPFPVNSRNPAQLRKILDSLAHQQYDAIFVSPFSHARVPELEALLNPARNLLPQAEIEATVRAVLDQTKSLLDYLSERFECPIFIHNAALVQRADNIVKVVTRALLTRRACVYAKRRINQWVTDYVVERNAATFRHLVILDEDALAQKIGRHNSGRCLHSSEFQHATVLSQHLAHEYHARISVIARLLGRKLVVCDLDNTLWDGVIGEGAVEHFLDRQRTLKRLQTHGGIVLSIASKNDPRNVHFTGGHLTADDFVAPQISWKHKAGAIDNIKAQLNLQTRHMVFLDDRADERALVMESHPDILSLDPGDPDVWKRLELWADLVHGTSDLDRTRLYREQAARDASFEPATECTLADGAFLQKLGLTISIRAADKSDLKRTAELINRTNQWNLCGSRTTFEEIRAWHASDTTQVLVASAADRFGEMGTVCVSVMTLGAQEAEIPIFVLSCRVFGYGVETAMLREIARRSDIGGARTKLIGHYRPTDQNYPARTMYADHGFNADSGRFVWMGEPALPTVAWADIRLT